MRVGEPIADLRNALLMLLTVCFEFGVSEALQRDEDVNDRQQAAQRIGPSRKREFRMGDPYEDAVASENARWRRL